MRKHFLYCAALLGVAACLLTACGQTEEPEQKNEKEEMLAAAMEPYTEHTVIAVYRALSDATMALSVDCDAMLAAYENGTLQEADIRKAADDWERARKQWELSEAFLFGPAANHNIDPHIDSWPLDRDAMLAMLNNASQMKQIEAEGADYIANNLGYGLLGFHAIEFMLYADDNADKSNIRLHALNYTRAELVYLSAVAADLMNQTAALEACWAGLSKVTEAKRQLLAAAELDGYQEMTKGYAAYFVHAGKAGSVFVSYQDAAEELIQGCIDIADEVGNTKIGKPAGLNEEGLDRNYIESPYSLNSIADFQDNIRSVQHAYMGSVAGDASVSDYIRTVNPDLDARLRAKLEESLRAIAAIPEPFAQHATESAAKHAVDVVGTQLVDLLQEVYKTIVNA